MRHNLKHPADCVSGLQRRVHFLLHFFLSPRVHTAQRRFQILTDRPYFVPRRRVLEPYMPDLDRMTGYFRAKLPEQLLRKSPGCDPRSGLPRRSPLQHVTRIMKIEFLRAGKIRMTRSRRYELSRFRLRSRRSLNGKYLFPVRPVPILDSQRDRRANRLPLPHSGENVRAIFLDFLPPAAPVAELPPLQLVIDKLDSNLQSRRETRHKRQQRLTVRLTRGIEAKHKLSSVSATWQFRPACLAECFPPAVLPVRVHAAKESPKMPGERHDKHAGKLQRHAPLGRSLQLRPPCPVVNPPTGPDNQCGAASGQKVPQQDALEPVAFQLPLPGHQPGQNCRKHRQRCERQVEVSGRRQILALGPHTEQIQRNCRDKERNREVNQRNVLRMFCQQHRSPVKGIHGVLYCTTTFAVILGWIEQKYVYVPGFVNV